MAINIRQPTFTYLPGYGQEEQSATGNFLGGVGTGLKDLLEHKIGEMNERKQYELMQQRARADEARKRQELETALEPILGEKAKSYSNLPESLLKPVVTQKINEPSRLAYNNSLSKVLAGKPLVPEDIQGLKEHDAEKLTQIALQKKQADEAEKLRIATETNREEQRKETNRLKMQTQINNANKPYLDKLSKGVDLATTLKDKVAQLRRLRETGNVKSGISALLPGILQNTETQQYDAISKEVASIIAGNTALQQILKLKPLKNSSQISRISLKQIRH